MMDCIGPKGRHQIIVCLLVSSVVVCLGNAVDDDPRLKAPWVASIFHKDANSGLWEYICGGTITGSYTVITSARCLLPKVNGEKFSSRPYHFNYDNLQVVAGLKTNDFKAKDEFTQYGIVGQIRDLNRFKAHDDTPHEDLAAIRLKTQFNMSTPYVKDVQLTEQIGTVLEANVTKPGDIVIVAGFERIDSSVSGIKTRSKSYSPLKVYELSLSDITSCMDRYTTSYDAYYFDVLCGKSKISKDVIPCHFEGAGMITKAKFRTKSDPDPSTNIYLMGVYSSNTASAKSEGFLNIKNTVATPLCTSDDYIFFTKLGYLGRWGISHTFCDNSLAMCQNDRCRPWNDLCDGKSQCDDKSDESSKVCFNQGDCKSNQFKCKYGACIDKSKICNGVQDCSDGSDEDFEKVCKNTQPVRQIVNCKGIPDQNGVEIRCTHPDRKDVYSCKNDVPVGTSVVLRRSETRAICTKDGAWSQNVMLTC